MARFLNRWGDLEESGRTLHFDEEAARKADEMNADGLILTVLEGKRVLARCDLTLMGKSQISFGSSQANDVVIAPESGVVSRVHGSFMVKEGLCTIIDFDSTNGLYVNGVKRAHSRFAPGDTAWIGRRELDSEEGVMFLLGYDSSPWRYFELGTMRRLSFGRAEDNDIVLPSRVVSAHHAVMFKGLDGRWHISDPGSYNGTFINAAPVVGEMPLRSGDLVGIADARIVFLGDLIVINAPK